MKPTGQAYLLLRPLDDHGRSIESELDKILVGKAKYSKVADVRGTDLIKINF